MSNIVYKMRHKPSGLFALSALAKYRGITNDLTKLTADGKVYVMKPKLPDAVFYVILPKAYKGDKVCTKTQPEDWEIVEYNLQERIMTTRKPINPDVEVKDTNNDIK
jgi:hypothetical protein